MSMRSDATSLRRPAITLADVLAPGERSALRDAALIVGGAGLTALAAQISFTMPWNPLVPYTFQTAAVLLVGTALGAWRGAASMALYVLAGAAGLPIYAGGASGIAQLLGATGGYLAGFIVAAALVGRLAERAWDRSRVRAALLMLLGTVVVYAVGVPVLAMVAPMPPADAIWFGAAVFVPWDVAKVVIAALALPAAWRLTSSR